MNTQNGTQINVKANTNHKSNPDNESLFENGTFASPGNTFGSTLEPTHHNQDGFLGTCSTHTHYDLNESCCPTHCSTNHDNMSENCQKQAYSPVNQQNCFSRKTGTAAGDVDSFHSIKSHVTKSGSTNGHRGTNGEYSSEIKPWDTFDTHEQVFYEQCNPETVRFTHGKQNANARNKELDQINNDNMQIMKLRQFTSPEYTDGICRSKINKNVDVHEYTQQQKTYNSNCNEIKRDQASPATFNMKNRQIESDMAPNYHYTSTCYNNIPMRENTTYDHDYGFAKQDQYENINSNRNQTEKYFSDNNKH